MRKQHMKKIKMFLLSAILLLSCMVPVTAMAESQSADVRYSVAATVIYRDYDGTSTTQKVDVGTILKAPQPKGKPGCIFHGWMNEKTGEMWDFSDPVSEHLTLVADYTEFQEDENGNILIGKGTFSVKIRMENHITEAAVDISSKELLNMLLEDGSITAEELEQVKEGASLEIVLVIRDGASVISDQSKEQLTQGADDYVIGQYLDIYMMKYLTVNGQTGDGQQISYTSGQITISIKIPENMINTDVNVQRSYIVLRNHEGTVEILDSEYDADTQTLTFRTNLFSDYAIAYKDVRITPDNDSRNQDSQKTAGRSPKTGDTCKQLRYGMMLLLAGSAIVALYYVRKKNIK